MGRVRIWVGCVAIAWGLFSAPATAEPDPVGAVANAICAGTTVGDIAATLADLGPVGRLSDEGVAEAFGEASFLADLGRCVSAQAIADAYASFKQGKEAEKLDVAFASGHMHGSPEGGTASVALYQGSYSGLGSAGDPPSGK